MTQDKELLLKDLCARLPYGVKCYGFQMKIDGNDNECYGVLKSISDCPYGWKFELKDRVALNNKKCYEENYLEVKPYLFPLSSMTDELWDKEFRGCGIPEFTLDSFKYGCETLELDNSSTDFSNIVRFINQLIKHHFDIYGLISMGLALDATGFNIY